MSVRTLVSVRTLMSVRTLVSVRTLMSERTLMSVTRKSCVMNYTFEIHAVKPVLTRTTNDRRKITKKI
jgi:hypothetical protein